jgi:predicted alpha/beta superfamily hydrolase
MRAAGTRVVPSLALLGAVAVPLAAQSPGAAGAPPSDSTPIHTTFVIESRAVGETRTINVYTPPGYGTSAGQTYPVLYMPDGGLAEDFPHIVNTIDSLIARHLIRPVLVVGIENTQRRRDLTGPTTVASDSAIAPRVGGSAAFREFIRDELMPEIRRRYRCTDEASIVGESLAGLFIVETFLLEPSLFRRYIALSPSVWWNGGALIRLAEPRIRSLDRTERTLFFASADETQIAPGTSALAATLRAVAPRSLRWSYAPRPDLHHDTIFRAVVPAAFASVLK